MLWRVTLLHTVLLECILASDRLYLAIDPSKENDVTKRCVVQVINDAIPCGALVTTVSTRDALDGVVEAIANGNCYSVVTRSIQTQSWLISTDVYLILLNDKSELSITMLELSRDVLWNPAVKFVIAINKPTNDNIIEMFSELLENMIYDVVIVASVDADGVQTFTYFPFANNNCGKYFDEIVNLDYCNDVSKRDIYVQRKDIDDYRGCTVLVGAKEVFPYAIMSGNLDLRLAGKYKIGIEQLVLETIAILEGMEIKYKSFSNDVFRGVVLPNNSATGMLSYLKSGEISLVAGGYTLILNRIKAFDYIWGYNYATYKIVTRAPTDTVWKKVYREFSVQSWTLIAVSLCVMCVVTVLILTCISQKHQDPIDVVLQLLDYLLDHSNNTLIVHRNLRLLLLFWIWYTYFINSFYKTAYYSLITGHVKEKRNFDWYNLSTFPYEPCVSQSGKSYFLYAYNLTFPNAKWIKECENTEASLDYVAEKYKFYTFATEYAYYRNAGKYIDESGNFKLDSWKILDATISTFYCHRGFALRKRFQKHSMRIFESGLIQAHLDVMKVKQKHFTHNNKKYYKNLILSDFRISFYILVIGTVISVACFIFEKFHNNYSLKQIV